MKKIGLLCLALVLALGALGVGYAAWTDSIAIDGTVNTGDVDIDIAEVSSTWVYKNLDTHGIEVVHVFGSVEPTPPANYKLIASAVAVIDPGDDTDSVTVTLDNLFPCADFKVNFLFRYDGSIPAKLSITDPVFTGDDADFFNSLVWTLPSGDPEDSYMYGEMWECDSAGTHGENIADLEGHQVHEGEYIVLVITLHLGQSAPMNADASFTTEFKVIQWNEYTP